MQVFFKTKLFCIFYLSEYEFDMINVDIFNIFFYLKIWWEW